MGKENMAMGTKAFSTGDKILRLMKDSRIGISDLKGVEPGVLVDSVLEQGMKDNGFYE